MALYKINPDTEFLYKHLDLYIDDEPLIGDCMIVQADQKCHHALHRSGFCSRHYSMMERHGLLQRYSFLSETCALEIYDQEEKGVCRIVDRGEKCQHETAYRGLCYFHCGMLEAQNYLEEFALPEYIIWNQKVNYTIRKPIQDHICRIADNGRSCTRLITKRGLCENHYARFRLAGWLDKYALPNKKSFFEVYEPNDKSFCRIIEDGNKCNVMAKKRGLCLNHYTRFRLAKQLNEYALESSRPDYERKYELYEQDDKSICRIIGDGNKCRRKVSLRGLCQTHYQRFQLAGHLDKYALASQRSVQHYNCEEYEPSDKSMCRIIEDGNKCSSKTKLRGLCSRHYERFRIAGQLDKYGLAKNAPSQIFNYEIYKPASEGVCRILQDGKACDRKVLNRGVCKLHWSRFQKMGIDALNKYGLPSKRVPLQNIKYEIYKPTSEGICRILEDGKACDREVLNRGLCMLHRARFKRMGDDVLDKYGLSKHVLPQNIKYEIYKPTSKGICRILEDGEACDRKVLTRGICSLHYSRFERTGIDAIDKYGLPRKRAQKPFAFQDYKIYEPDVKGLCRIIEKEKKCDSKCVSRGLCTKHYSRFKYRGLLKKYVKPKKTIEGRMHG